MTETISFFLLQLTKLKFFLFSLKPCIPSIEQYKSILLNFIDFYLFFSNYIIFALKNYQIGLLLIYEFLRIFQSVLSLASSYFQKVLWKEPNTQSVIVFRDIEFRELKNLIEFIYT